MYYFIVNPNSKSRKGIELWKKLKKLLLDEDISFREFITRGSGDATNIAKEITTKSQSKNIIVLGGDGTLHEVITGIEDLSFAKIGYIPTGSSNDFARGMKLSSDIEKLLEHLLVNPAERRIDYGVCDAQKGRKGRFLVSSGIGYDAKVCHLANSTKTKSILNALRLGKLTYVQIGLQGLMDFELFHAKVMIDDMELEVEDTLFISVHNLPYEGGGVKFCPEASPEDGYLDVCIVAGIGKMAMLPLLPKALKGKHVGHRGVYQYRCKKIVIETKEEQYYHMDGEVPGKTVRMEVSVSKEGIRYI